MYDKDIRFKNIESKDRNTWSYQGNLSKIRSSANLLYTPSFSMTTMTLASFEVTLISTPSSVMPFSSRSIHSLVMGRPWTEESAVPSIEPLTSFPDGNVPLLIISTLPQNHPAVKHYRLSTL